VTGPAPAAVALTKRIALALAFLVACAHEGPPREPWDQWVKPGGEPRKRPKLEGSRNRHDSGGFDW